MKITFRVRFDAPGLGNTRRFTFHDDLPYPGVPRVDEHVMLTSNKPGQLFGERRVVAVAYSPDGYVILEIKGHHMTNDPKSLIDLLLDAGYVEQEPL